MCDGGGAACVRESVCDSVRESLGWFLVSSSLLLVGWLICFVPGGKRIIQTCDMPYTNTPKHTHIMRETSARTNINISRDTVYTRCCCAYLQKAVSLCLYMAVL